MIKNSMTDTVTRLRVIKDCLPSDFYTESMNYRLLMELNEHLKRLASAELASLPESGFWRTAPGVRSSARWISGIGTTPSRKSGANCAP